MSDAEVNLLKWIGGIGLGVIFALVGVIYGLLRAEDKRLAKNLHQLRADMSPIALWVQVIKDRLGLK